MHRRRLHGSNRGRLRFHRSDYRWRVVFSSKLRELRNAQDDGFQHLLGWSINFPSTVMSTVRRSIMTKRNEIQGVGRRAFIGTAAAMGTAAIGSSVGADESSIDAKEWRTVSPRSSSIQPWMMPAHFGMPKWEISDADVPVRDALYDDVTIISIDYRTDRNKLINYLPLPFELDGPPIVTVAYSMNRDISWLAGGHYNIITVSARARYPGENDQVSGNFAFVLWENLTEPILPGREQQGMPKVFGDIRDHREHNGTWSTTLSNNGKTMLDIEASGLKELTDADFERFQSDNGEVNLLGWKYIPNETRSAAILSYATLFPFSYEFRSAWTAKGTLTWSPREWSELPTQAHIVNAMAGLPIKEYVSCTVSKARLILRTSLVRRLT